MRIVFTVALASLLLWSQAAECRAQSPSRTPKQDADALAAVQRIAGGLELSSDKDSALFYLSQSYEKVGRFDEAERVASSMDDGGLKAGTLVRLAGVLAEAGKLDRVVGLLEESLQTIRRAGKDEFNSSSAYVLSTLVGGEGRWDSDALTLNRVTDKGVLARLVEAGCADEAAKVLSLVKSVALDFEMDDEAQVKLFAGASRLYARSGDAAAVEEALADASAAASRMEDDADKALALCELADAYFGAGNRERAESTLAEAARIASPLEDRRDLMLRRITRGYAEAGLYEQAREVARTLSEEEGARAFATLAALGPASKPADFDAALSYAVSAAVSLSLESDSKRAWALVELVSTYGARSPAALAKVAEAALSLGEPGSRALVLIAVGDGHWKAGRKDAALDFWRQALASARALELSRVDIHPGDSRMNDEEKLKLLFALASRFADAGSHGQALEIVRDVEEVRERALRLAEGHPTYALETAPTLAKLAAALLRAGRRGDALEVLEAASRTAHGGEESMYVDSLGAVAAAYAKAGESARAKLHFRRALEAAQAIEFMGDSGALGVLTNVGTYYAEAGMKPDAAYQKAMRRLVRRVEKEIE